VIGDSLQVSRGQDEMKVRRGDRGVLCHSHEKCFEDLVAILIDDVVAFEDLRCQIHILVDQGSEAFRNHRANSRSHWLKFGRRLDFAHAGQRDGALA
jgi:hypothetical protein